MDKTCKNCRDKNNCAILDKLQFNISDEVQFKLEEGIFEEAVKEHLELESMFQELQDKNIIKKNIKIKDIEDEYIKQIITEQVSEGIWKFLLREMKNIKPNIKMLKGDDFYCSEWR